MWPLQSFQGKRDWLQPWLFAQNQSGKCWMLNAAFKFRLKVGSTGNQMFFTYSQWDFQGFILHLNKPVLFSFHRPLKAPLVSPHLPLHLPPSRPGKKPSPALFTCPAVSQSLRPPGGVSAAMAESQLMCMEDGHIGAKVPETKPEFYYSEEQRVAIEELLKNGDGAFKTRLKEDDVTDFLSAREVKMLLNTFKQYESEDDSSSKAAKSRSEQDPPGSDADSGVHSTYWPQMSDTEVPPLDIGWPSGGMFKGVTRVAVHTHPPKENGPHIKEVVRRLIQESSKVRGALIIP